MATFTRRQLSGSTNGRMIQVTATGTATAGGGGVTVHTSAAATGIAGTQDEVYLWAKNTADVNLTLTVRFGATGATDSSMFTIASKDGMTLVVPGMVLNNSLVVKAAASSGVSISVGGYVNRIAT